MEDDLAYLVNPQEDDRLVNPMECFWRDYQPWLEERGYILRPRYSPDWVPSWKGTKKPFYHFEDGHYKPVCLYYPLTSFNPGAQIDESGHGSWTPHASRRVRW